jgi:hypothetical protein
MKLALKDLKPEFFLVTSWAMILDRQAPPYLFPRPNPGGRIHATLLLLPLTSNHLLSRFRASVPV